MPDPRSDDIDIRWPEPQEDPEEEPTEPWARLLDRLEGDE